MASLDMQTRLNQIKKRHERFIKPYDKQLITMNVEEKADFFRKRALVLKELADSTGIPEHKRTELAALGIKLEELQDLPLC